MYLDLLIFKAACPLLYGVRRAHRPLRCFFPFGRDLSPFMVYRYSERAESVLALGYVLRILSYEGGETLGEGVQRSCGSIPGSAQGQAG